MVLSRALFQAKADFAAGERDAKDLLASVVDLLATEPLVKLQYVSCAHPDTLQELNGQVSQALISLAANIGKTRLIDNVLLEA
ncbi:MAG: hypothetical protein A2136_05880 [Chloroflexi bacterium RBG_16_54_11]|nr:MAG: hypothetical protein A2136_05880 [Chloroflexi bacterium RBG_16_54_11]